MEQNDRSFDDSRGIGLRDMPSGSDYTRHEKSEINLSSPYRGTYGRQTTDSFMTLGQRSSVTVQGRHSFKSYRLKGAYEQPWRSDARMKKTNIGNWFVRFCVVLGLGLSAIINWYNYNKVPKHDVRTTILERHTTWSD